MSNLKEIKDRIASVQSTLKITSAMKMVAASKLRKAQNAILQMRPYAKKLEDILTDTIATFDNEYQSSLWMKENENANHILFIVIASNKGLCGNFNSEIIKNVFKTIRSDYQKFLDEGMVDFMTFGKKVTEFLQKRHFNVINAYDSILNDPSYAEAAEITENIIKQYKSGYYSKVILIYNHFKNASSQIVSIENFLPYSTSSDIAGVSKNKDTTILFPDKAYVLKSLILKNLKIQLFKALLESLASEHGARMTAMHKASDNAANIINSLKLKYNKMRQANITNQLIEIISGAEALNK